MLYPPSHSCWHHLMYQLPHLLFHPQPLCPCACVCPCSVEFRPDVELHEHKLTVLYRRALREQVLPHLHASLAQAGLRATVIEGGSGGA